MSTTTAPPASPVPPGDRADEAAPRRGRRGWRPNPWVAVPVLVYLLLSLFGVTTSSIGSDTLRADPEASHSDQVLEPVSIRTDEYLTSTPLAIGVTATGDAEDLNPLTGPQGFSTQFPSTAVSSLVLFDGTALRAGTVLPDQMLIAARWWLPALLLFLGAPAFFRSLVGSRWPGLFAAVLILLSPATAWWSLSPLGVLGFTLAGAAALQRAAQAATLRAPWWRPVGWGLLSALLLARTPMHYQPWMIVVAPAILALAIVPMLAARDGRRRRIVVVAATGALSLLLAAAVFWENRASVQASLGTVYPGSRVSSGSATGFETLFGATSMAPMRWLATVDTNASELSSSYLVAGVVAVLLLIVGVRFRSAEHRVAVWTLLVTGSVWWVWCTVDFGAIGERIPLANLVPPGRAAQMVGYLAVLLFCLVLPGLADRTGWRVAVGSGVVSAAIGGYAGSLLTQVYLPGLTVKSVWLSALLLGAVVTLIVARPRWWVGYTAAGVTAFLVVWQVNPVLVGLGDLRDSAIARQLLEEGSDDRAAGVVWATDDPGVDTLLTATGVPALSGRQLSGPDDHAWERLDPGAGNDHVWNRGGSFITFAWTDDPELSFENPTADVIEISGSPCAVAERMPELSTVVSGEPLEQSCLVPEGSFDWGGRQHYRYAVGS